MAKKIRVPNRTLDGVKVRKGDKLLVINQSRRPAIIGRCPHCQRMVRHRARIGTLHFCLGWLIARARLWTRR